MAARQITEIGSLLRESEGTERRAVRVGSWLLPAVLALALAGPAAAQSATSGGDGPLPLPLPAPDAKPKSGPAVEHLKDALKQMNAQNPVVARVDGHEIRWAQVVASAEDLPAGYRDQIESVFPALLDRLVDLHLLADAARKQGLADDPKVRQRLDSYEDRVLSEALLERYLAKQVTTASLRQRYDAMVAARRADREIRARHILVDTEAEAKDIIAKLNAGAVFITLAKEFSKGPSASRGGDLGYFQPSRMAPAFARATLKLEPGEYTHEPVKTEFGWHVIQLVDRRADNIPSFLDMQDGLRKEAKKEAIDKLVFSLRQQASLQMFPDDHVAAPAAKAEDGK